MKQSSIRRWLSIAITALLTCIAGVSLIPVVAIAHGNARNVLVIATCVSVLLICYVVGGVIYHRFQITLRVLLAFIALLSIAFAMLGNRLLDAWKQRRAVATVVQAGGSVDYDYTDGFDDSFKTSNGLLLPNWAMRTFGRDVFSKVSSVTLDVTKMPEEALQEIDFHDFPSVTVAGIRLSETSHQQLGTLSQLRELRLFNTGTNDEDMKAFAGLMNLKSIVLMGIPITDDGLEILERLPNLKQVHVQGTNTTSTGRTRLRERSPDCRLYYVDTPPPHYGGSPPF